jgi:hypothetical protein
MVVRKVIKKEFITKKKATTVNALNCMIKHFKYSKVIHTITLLCFLLPFFYTGCEKQKVSKAMNEAITDSMAVADSVNIQPHKIGCLETNSLDSVKNVISTDDTTSENKTEALGLIKPQKQEEVLSQILSTKYSFLKPLLIPTDETYSGIGAFLNLIPFFKWFAIFLSFLLLVIGLVIKFIDSGSIISIVLIDTIALISLIFSQTPSWNCERLWGFACCVFLASILTFYDLFICKRNRSFTNIKFEN